MVSKLSPQGENQMSLLKDLQQKASQSSLLSESDEDRFKTPDAMSAMPLKEAVIILEKQYLLCKKDRLPPSSDQWLLWSAVFMRSWIARTQSEPDHPELFRRKAFFVLWWNRGAALKHYADSASRLIKKKKAAGISKDSDLLRSQVVGEMNLNQRQRQWVEEAFKTLLPLVKKQILATIPPSPAQKRPETPVAVSN